ncbi:MAG TPA: metallophosphoesterase family protein [Actinomycetota bacterium]|nr:metallophosphoesterase family protein [Actinomycetota bacterium]
MYGGSIRHNHPMKVVVLADTHTRGFTRAVPMGAWPYIENADHILHAGDVVDPALLDELKAFAPVTVVMGNVDSHDIMDWGATEEASIELDGVRIGMVHDSGLAPKRRERMRARFPDARVVVFGHSHMPVNEDADGLLLFNPGSPTWKRTAPFPSMGILWIENGDVEGEIFPV